jgi:hypothetical protein
MAASTPSGHGRPDEDGGRRSLLDSFDPRETLCALAFWTAVVLPALHVPLLAAGLSTPGERHAFVALLALNVLSLYGGHAHYGE